MKNESELIPSGMYRNIATHTPLNVALKQFFSELESIEDCEQLQLSLYQVREHLIEQHHAIVSKLKDNEITKALAFRLIQDKSSSSGGHFLRWRSTVGQQYKSRSQGGLVWKNIITDQRIPYEVKKRVAEMEKEKLVLNMQMSVLNYMLRQLTDTIEKQSEVSQLCEQCDPNNLRFVSNGSYGL